MIHDEKWDWSCTIEYVKDIIRRNWITNQAQYIVTFYLIKAEAINGPAQSNLIIDELQYFIEEGIINPSINHLKNTHIPLSIKNFVTPTKLGTLIN